MLSNSRIAVVIPAFNEGKSIRNDSDEFIKDLTTFCPDAGAIFVDDGSHDDTYSELNSTISKHKLPNITCIKLDENQGYGGALREGTLHAQKLGYEYVVFMDSDNTNPVSELPVMISKLEGHALVKASRFLPSSDASAVPWRRRFFSIYGNHILRIMFLGSIKDITNGFRAWEIEAYLRIPLLEKGFTSIVEEFYFARLYNYRITEVPSVLSSRLNSQNLSKTSYKPRILWLYFKPGLRFLANRFKTKDFF